MAAFDRIKDRLSALVGAGYMAHRFSNLALAEVDGRWGDLSVADISQLAAWLRERQSATNSEVRVEWTYILAAFASVWQIRDPSSAQLADVRPDGTSRMAGSAHDPPPLATDRDGSAAPREELPLLAVRPSMAPTPVPMAPPANAPQRGNPHRKRSATKRASRRPI
jgi:hypothetical protein